MTRAGTCLLAAAALVLAPAPGCSASPVGSIGSPRTTLCLPSCPRPSDTGGGRSSEPRIAFMGHDGGDYDIYVADVDTGRTRRLTDAPGSDGWPAWSPDGATIAFSSERDDCLHAPRTTSCWTDPEAAPGEHRDIWLMDADGSRQRRVTPEAGQFVAWAPDGRHLLVSGYSLYVVRPDGTGRAEVRGRSGGIPDWVAP